MLAKTAQELRAIKSHYFLPVVAVIAPSECHLLVRNAQNPVIGDGDLVGVPAKVIDDRSRSCKGLFGVDHPVLIPADFDPVGMQWVRLSQPCHQLCLENPGNCFNREKKDFAVLRYGNSTPISFHPDTTTGHNAVDMRMQRKVLAPGVQHGDHTAFCLQSGEEELVHCLPHRPEQQVVHRCTVCHEQRVKLIRHSKDHMKIGNREQILFALPDPCFALCVLALRTMTVAAAVVAYADVTACVAPVHMTAQGGSAAATDRTQGFEHIPVWIVLFSVLSAKPFNDLCQLKGRLQPAW